MDENYFSNKKIYSKIETLKKTMLDKMNKLKVKSFDISDLGYQYCLDDENDFETTFDIVFCTIENDEIILKGVNPKNTLKLSFLTENDILSILKDLEQVCQRYSN